MNRILLGAFLVFVLLTCGPTRGAAANGDTAAGPAPTPESAAESPPKSGEGSANAFDRRSPRDTVKGFLEATTAGDYREADAYLALPASARAHPEAAARKLRTVLDRQVWIDLDSISAEPEGMRDDGLPADRESLGWLDTPDGPRAVELERTERDGGKRWVFTADTVTSAIRTYDKLGYGRLTAMLPAPLFEYQLLHVELWQWIALLLLAPAAYLIAWLVTYLVARMLASLARRTQTSVDDEMVAFSVGPVRLIVAVAIFSAVRLPLGLTAVARTVLAAGEYLLIVAAVTWLVLRLLDVVSNALQDGMLRRGQQEAIHLVPPGRRSAKVCVVAIAIIALLDGFGFNVTTLLAGLGVGGIAVALAAQKSIENLFGGITLYADRPVRVGDFCRFGGTVGTVEDIGLRSTRVRTLERCLVSVPNAEFSNLQLENFSQRDKFWYHPTIGLRYETTPDQLRYVLVEVRRLLYAHPKVDPQPARIRFVGFGASSLDLEVFAYVLAKSYDEFLEIAEDLNLRLMDVIAAAGTGFAFPSRTIYVEPGSGMDVDRGKHAEQEVAQWREQDALYLPRFPDDKISELHGTLEYPPSGSPHAENHNGGRRR